jgi:spermidine synthase
MVPWKLMGRAPVPGEGPELVLYSRGEEYSIRVGAAELMNSRVYSRDDELSKLGCQRIRERKKARVLIGGLGMGYSLVTALNNLGPDAEVVIAELVPGLVQWNRDVFGHLAGHPLGDRRTTLREADVGTVIREQTRAYDAILLDVDNGPNGLTRRANDWLYSDAGITLARDALRPDGVLGYWSASPDRAFVKRLHRASLLVEELEVRAQNRGRGARITLWLATRYGASSASAK